MRVIAGSLGGRLFDSPHSVKTHPMSDKIRGALFNVLGDIEGLSVLDAFAGSGALSFEAASRGAQEVVAIDHDRAAQEVILANIEALGLDDTVKLVKASAGAWLQTSTTSKFDIVLCDPPYDELQLSLVKQLSTVTKVDGIFVLSLPGNEITPQFDTAEFVDRRNYGDAALVFYRRIR